MAHRLEVSLIREFKRLRQRQADDASQRKFVLGELVLVAVDFALVGVQVLAIMVKVILVVIDESPRVPRRLWRMVQNYYIDLLNMRVRPIADKHLAFS